MDFLYEPYFLSLLVALICTLIYYFIEKNKQPISEEEEKPKKKSLSPLLKSILIFIFSYSLFTGLFYVIKHYLYPKR